VLVVGTGKNIDAVQGDVREDIEDATGDGQLDRVDVVASLFRNVGQVAGNGLLRGGEPKGVPVQGDACRPFASAGSLGLAVPAVKGPRFLVLQENGNVDTRSDGEHRAARIGGGRPYPPFRRSGPGVRIA
jgi:hypothetical protein